jgi:UPF0271 protein
MSPKPLKLNCDMGEHVSDSTIDAQIMPYIDMSNIACGFHAGDAITMTKCVKVAKVHGVSIGAHPSYDDVEGFGRREMACTEEEITALILNQCGALDDICKAYGTRISYVKPHGALYNTMMKEMQVFETVVKAVAQYDKNIKLMILSNVDNHKYSNLAKKYGITLLYEVFADRAYQDDGQLVPRSQDGAVLESVEEVLKRAKVLKEYGYIESIKGKKLTLQVDTLCVHGDNAQALNIIKALHQLNMS